MRSTCVHGKPITLCGGVQMFASPTQWGLKTAHGKIGYAKHPGFQIFKTFSTTSLSLINGWVRDEELHEENMRNQN